TTFAPTALGSTGCAQPEAGVSRRRVLRAKENACDFHSFLIRSTTFAPTALGSTGCAQPEAGVSRRRVLRAKENAGDFHSFLIRSTTFAPSLLTRDHRRPYGPRVARTALGSTGCAQPEAGVSRRRVLRAKENAGVFREFLIRSTTFAPRLLARYHRRACGPRVPRTALGSTGGRNAPASLGWRHRLPHRCPDDASGTRSANACFGHL
ncbi:hypothetical protein, partial [Roseospira marina]|uniref:hypothetical protein n=1 Tax=Roseospira marina TaxID=140057 RepID=UPI001C865491